MIMTGRVGQAQWRAEYQAISSSNEQFYYLYQLFIQTNYPSNLNIANHSSKTISTSISRVTFSISSYKTVIFQAIQFAYNNCFILNINTRVQMDKSPKARSKKQYFTKSQALLPSIHPNQQFLSIIQLKKHYQSLIKQQLNALNHIENAQTQEINQWQKQIQQQVKVSLFEPKQTQEAKHTQKLQKVQKSSQQFISCYERLRLIKKQKSFLRMKGRLQLQRLRGVKQRAASYFCYQSLSQKWFTKWKQQANQALSQAKTVKNKQIKLCFELKKLYFKSLINQIKFTANKKQAKRLFFLNKKKVFLNRICMAASFRFQKIKYKNGFDQLKKKQGWRSLKHYLQERKQVSQVKMKSKLLKNIFCHRRFNIFFNACKQKLFKKEQAKITHQIISKIDVLQLISSSSQISYKAQKSQTQQAIFHSLKEKGVINIPLLHLILQNFVEEYSQEYSANFNEQQRLVLLEQLKAQCICELLYKQNCLHFINNLSYYSKCKKVQIKLQELDVSAFLKRLNLNKQLKTSLTAFKKTIKIPKITEFFKIMKQHRSISVRMRQFNQRKLRWRFQGKNVLDRLRKNLTNKQIIKFNTDIAVNWRQIQIYKKAFNSWAQLQQAEKSQSGNAYLDQKETIQVNKLSQKIGDNQQEPNYQLMTETVIKGQQQEKKNEQPENQEIEQTQRVTKAKMQLSKIVSVISKNMGSKYSFDNYSRSIQSQQSNKLPLLRLKTESAQINQENDYEPRAMELQELCKKQSQQEEMLRQSDRKTSKVSSKIRQMKLLKVIKNIQIEWVFSKKTKQLAKTILTKHMKQLRRKFQLIKINNDKKQLVIGLRKAIAFQSCLSNQNSSKIIKQNQLSLKKQMHRRGQLQFFKIIRQNQQFGFKKQSLDLLIFSLSAKTAAKKLQQATVISLATKKHMDFVQKISKKRELNAKKYLFASLIFLLRKHKLMLFSYKKNWQKFKHNIEQQKNMNGKRKEDQNTKKQFRQQQNLAKYLGQSPTKEEFVFQFQLGQNIFQSKYQPQSQAKSSIIKDIQGSLQVAEENQASNNQETKSQGQNYQDYQVEKAQHDQEQHQLQGLPESQLDYQQQEMDLLERLKQQQKALRNQRMLSSSKKGSISQKQRIQDQHIGSKNIKGFEKQQFINESFEQQENQDWLDQQIKEKQLKKYLFKERSSYFIYKLTRRQQKQAQFLQQACKGMLLKRCLVKWLHKHREIEQKAIKKQQLLDIVQYQLFKRQKQLKRNIFRALAAQVQVKKGLELKRKCFSGWMLFSRQKKMLKQYLSLQEKSSEVGLSYYPSSRQEKQRFDQLKFQ